jgi:hypothetical protein
MIPKLDNFSDLDAQFIDEAVKAAQNIQTLEFLVFRTERPVYSFKGRSFRHGRDIPSDIFKAMLDDSEICLVTNSRGRILGTALRTCKGTLRIRWRGDPDA